MRWAQTMLMRWRIWRIDRNIDRMTRANDRKRARCWGL